MHDWRIIASPWPGIHLAECKDCGWRAWSIAEAKVPGVTDIPSSLAVPASTAPQPASEVALLAENTSRSQLLVPGSQGRKGSKTPALPSAP